MTDNCKSERTVPLELTEAEARALLAFQPPEVDNLAVTARALVKIEEGLAALPPAMDEPTYPGAVVMTDRSLYVCTDRPGTTPLRWTAWDAWTDDGRVVAWSDLGNPRPLTPTERRDRGMPALLPDGHVAVKVVRDEGDTTTARPITPAQWRCLASAHGSQYVGQLAAAYADALEAEGEAL